MSDTHRAKAERVRVRRRDRDKPRRYRTDRNCKAKRRYLSEVEVFAAGMLSIMEEQNRTRLWCYRCRHCEGWHLTSANQGARWLITVDNTARDERRVA